jgi:Peptidase of plants and bacteria
VNGDTVNWSELYDHMANAHFTPGNPFLAVCLGLTLLCSCSTSPNKHALNSCVRSVGVNAASQKELAERAKQVGNQMYPRVCGLLSEGKCQSPSGFNIEIKPQLPNGNLGQTRLRTVLLNANYIEEFQNEPGLLDEVLIHEMGHVAQHYYQPIIGRWLVFTHNPPGFWVEGIADYICFKLLQTNAWACAECGSTYPHYRDGYSCAGAFLLFLESTFNPMIVPQLNTALRQGRYSENFFVKMTGKDLPSLWTQFQKTSAFTPSAARMMKVRQELGFIDEKPPNDIEQRLKTYLKEHADPPIMELMALGEIPGMNGKNVQSRLALICYFTQPGGPAEAFMVNLQQKEELPGFSKCEHGRLSSMAHRRQLDLTFPAVRSFTATKQGDNSIYHSTVIRTSEESAWTMRRAWRTNLDGTLAEEYSIPR